MTTNKSLLFTSCLHFFWSLIQGDQWHGRKSRDKFSRKLFDGELDDCRAREDVRRLEFDFSAINVTFEMLHLHKDAQTSFLGVVCPPVIVTHQFYFSSRTPAARRVDWPIGDKLLLRHRLQASFSYLWSTFGEILQRHCTLKLSESFQELSSLTSGDWINISHCRFERQILSIQYTHLERGWRQGLGTTMTITVKASFRCRKALPSPGHAIPAEHTNEDQEDLGCD